MQTRSATVEDVDLILGWLNQEDIWEVDCPEPYEVKTTEAFAPQWRDLVHRHAVWIVSNGTRPIGHMGWVLHGEAVAEFFIIIGEAGERGRGHGRVAMARLEQEAVRHGIHTLFASVLGNNRGALRFFGALGYAPVQIMKDIFVRNGAMQDLHWLYKRLT